MSDTTGIRVDVIETGVHKSFGHPSWMLPLGGGRVRDDRTGVVIEVRPVGGEVSSSSRSYDELQRIAAACEDQGGFARSSGGDGQTLTVGEDVLTGDDALDFMIALWRRAEDRLAEARGDSGYEKVTYNQGWNDALRAVEAAQKTVGKRY